MTNYERICIDKAFCAATIADVIGEDFFDKTMAWLDTEQREVTDEREQDVRAWKGAVTRETFRNG